MEQGEGLVTPADHRLAVETAILDRDFPVGDFRPGLILPGEVLQRALDDRLILAVQLPVALQLLDVHGGGRVLAEDQPEQNFDALRGTFDGRLQPGS